MAVAVPVAVIVPVAVVVGVRVAVVEAVGVRVGGDVPVRVGLASGVDVGVDGRGVAVGVGDGAPTAGMRMSSVTETGSNVRVKPVPLTG